MELDAMILVFLMLTFKPAFSLSSFTLIKMLFSSSSLSAITVVSYGGIISYLRLMILLLAILIPICVSFSTAFHLMYSAHKQGDNIQPSVQFSSVAQSCQTLQPHTSQPTRPPCPSPAPGVHPNPCPSSRWCLPTISSSYTALTYSFPNFEPVRCSTSSSVSSWHAYRFFRRQVTWSVVPISLRSFHKFLWSTQPNFQACCDPHTQWL